MIIIVKSTQNHTASPPPEELAVPPEVTSSDRWLAALSPAHKLQDPGKIIY